MLDLIIENVCFLFGSIIGLICLATSYVIGSQRNTPLVGFLLGLLGPLGLLACLMIDQRRRCPVCNRRVNHGEPSCHGCGNALQWSPDRLPTITRVDVSRTCPECKTTVSSSDKAGSLPSFWTCPICGTQTAVR